MNEGEQMKQMKLSDEEIQILIDGTEDTRNQIFNGIAKPVNERYIYLVKSLNRRLEDLLKKRDRHPKK